MDKRIILFFLCVFVFLGARTVDAIGDWCGDGFCSEKTAVKDPEVPEIDYRTLKNLLRSNGDYVLLDVRHPRQYSMGYIEGAQFFPYAEMTAEEVAKRLPNKEIKIVTYCFSYRCSISRNASKKLMSLGYSVVDYRGGVTDWGKHGGHLVRFK